MGLLLDFYAKAVDRQPLIWSMLKSSRDLRQVERNCRAHLCNLEQNGFCHDGVWSKFLLVSLNATMGSGTDEGCMHLSSKNAAGDELCTVRVRDPSVQRWVDTEPMLVDAVGRRDVILKFVLPNGCQASQADYQRPLVEPFPCTCD